MATLYYAEVFTLPQSQIQVPIPKPTMGMGLESESVPEVDPESSR